MRGDGQIKIIIEESAGIVRNGEPVRLGVPVARGLWQTGKTFVVKDPSGQLHPCQTKTLKQWPDGSIKWLLVDFFVTTEARNQSSWILCQGAETSHPHRVRVIKESESWRVDTGAGWFKINLNKLGPFSSAGSNGEDNISLSGSSCDLLLDDQTLAESSVELLELEEDGPLHAIVRMGGSFGGSELVYQCRLHFFAGLTTVKIVMTLHNPKAAEHPDGLWDLGDRGSVFFAGLNFNFDMPHSDQRILVCQTESGQKPIVASVGESLLICQNSSGGENWASPNHRNHAGEIALTGKGYKVQLDGQNKLEGDRATPIFWAGEGSLGLAVTCSMFWQEFPKSLSANQDSINVGLFPQCFNDLFELQGGEQKTHEFYLDIAVGQNNCKWVGSPLDVMVDAKSCHNSGVFIDLPSEEGLIDKVVNPTCLVAKREIVDEYGWRNFGEVYADHEAVGANSDRLFVSHYNNQYDVIAGAYKKALSSSSVEWLSIARQLAKHVQDIDIYHTNLDREEYNGGLFWHTDHYVDAELSSHRSYSRDQHASYEAHAGGGGPGAEHCYTTGLKYHYYLTGDSSFRDSVLQLAEWELIALSGPQTVLAATKRFVDNIRHWWSVSEDKDIFPSYPLSRGTGNAIKACLDAFDLSDDNAWLSDIADILRRTLHYEDDIEKRNLLNAEISWSYTVLLGALVDYLDKKIELGQSDDDFHFARNCLLHYADWMVNNEYPFLEKPEILEYPNETWVAQDLRKSVIFYHAARYSSNSRKVDIYLEKSRFFHDYVFTELPTYEGYQLTRSISLVLQNGWVGSALAKENIIAPFNADEVPVLSKPLDLLTPINCVKRYMWDLKRVITKTSFRREWNWFVSRM